MVPRYVYSFVAIPVVVDVAVFVNVLVAASLQLTWRWPRHDQVWFGRMGRMPVPMPMMEWWPFL